METTSSSNNLYNLKWDDHYSKVVLDSVWGLLGEEMMTDCTLVCSPSSSSSNLTSSPSSPTSSSTPPSPPPACSSLLRVHRLILSANSPYFRSLLNNHAPQHPHPIIILHDVEVEVMRLLVRFMYRGEITVPTPLFPTLLRTAENLQIIGLTNHLINKIEPHPLHHTHPVTTTTTPTSNNQTTPTQHYSKKARILESGSFSRHNSGGNEGNREWEEHHSGGVSVGGAIGVGVIGEVQEEPLALRKHPLKHRSSTDYYYSSISAPSTPYPNPTPPTTGVLTKTEEDTDTDEELVHHNLRGRSHSGDHHHGNTGHQRSSYPSSPTNTTTDCPYCELNFSSAVALTTHISHAHQQQQIICKFCSKPFPEVSALIQHLPIHTGERPFKCEYCGKAFKLRHHMKDHARVHTGERPFRCSLCGKTFSRSTILKAHEKTHFPKGNSNGGSSQQGQENG